MKEYKVIDKHNNVHIFKAAGLVFEEGRASFYKDERIERNGSMVRIFYDPTCIDMEYDSAAEEFDISGPWA